MNTNTPAAQELLRLFKCIVLTGTPVLTNFAKDKLLPPYNGNFDLFLEDKKHEIFHLWQSQKLLCCACPPSGCYLKRTNHMVSWIFKKMYDDNGPENRGHIVRHKHDKRKIVQVCLHKFVKRHIPIHELDISVVSFLLRNLANLSPTETTSLDIITTRRSEICHAHAMNCYPMALLNTAWNELENALLDLADPSYKPMIRCQIKNLRQIDLEKEEITDILSNIEKVSKEVKASFNNNVDFLINMENRFENKSISNREDIKQHITDETSLIAGQVQQALLGNIQNTEENLKTCFKQRVEKVIESQENSFQNIGTQLLENRSDTKEGHEKTQAMLVEFGRTIQNLELSVKYEVPTNLLVPVEPCLVATERPVLWQLGTPQHWNLDAVEAILSNPVRKDETFKMKFVKKGSLIMLTTIAASVLSNSEAFEAAIFSFLTKVIEDCDINTEIPGRVDVTLHILNDNEGIPSKMTEFEKCDVAFLNGDDEQEIEWVQNMSTQLKAKFDLNCAILAKDCLNGFPLRKSLGKYFDICQAVIVTLTKDNYGQYDFYVADDMPVIAVELDYVNEIRLNLRKCPYIDCTTCEDLWFPQFIDIIKVKLPDHLKKKMNNYTATVNENCEKCRSSVNTAVFHGIELRQGLHEMRLILCGSLTDEAWILNLLYQMANFTDQYRITTWNKSIGTPLPFTTNTIFVLNSPNLLKCKQINDYIDSNHLVKTISLYSIKIAPAEGPYTSGFEDSYIDATYLNYKELADKICMSVKNFPNMVEHSDKAKPQAAIMCVFCDEPNVKLKCEECGHMCNACKDKVHRRLKSSHKHKLSSLIRKNIYYKDQPWYHGNKTRNEAVNLLQKHKYMGDGAFLVRELQSSIGSFVIDCMLRGEPKHVLIKTKEMSGQLKYYVGGELFDGLNDVIEFFKSNALPLIMHNVILTEPVLQETYM